MAFTVSITPTNPTNVCAGEIVHFVATPASPVGEVTYWWQEYVGGAWSNISGETNATYNLTSQVGTTKIRVAANDTDSTVYSSATWVIATSVYDTFGAGLATIHTDLGTLHTDLATANGHLAIIRKATE